MSVAQDYRNVRGFILRGTRASQPVVADVLIGAIYFVTDESVLERSNGIIWESYSPSGGSGSIGLQGPPGIDGSDGFDGDIYPNGNVVKERTTPVFTTVTTTGNATVGGSLQATGVVQNSIGGSVNANAFLTIGGSGSFTGSGGATRGVFITSALNLQGAPNDDIYGYLANVTVSEAASGTHPIIAGIRAGLTITAGAAATTLATSGYFGGFTAPTGTVTAATIFADSAPTGATNNYALLIDSGTSRFNGTLMMKAVSEMSGALGNTYFNLKPDNVQKAIFGMSGAIKGDASTNLMLFTESGGSILLATNGSATEKVTIASAGGVRFHTYGAGTATFDASGNITSVSDEKLKTNISEFKIGLKEIMGVNPIKFRYSVASGLDTENDYTGFSAQNVMKFIPEAVGKNLQGDYSLNDRALLAAAVNAIKTLKSEIDELRSALGLPAKDYAPKVRNYYENNMIISRKKAS